MFSIQSHKLGLEDLFCFWVLFFLLTVSKVIDLRVEVANRIYIEYVIKIHCVYSYLQINTEPPKQACEFEAVPIYNGLCTDVKKMAH